MPPMKQMATIALAGAMSVAGTPAYGLSVTRFVSNDNHVYLVVTTTSSFTQVTSVSLQTGTPCSLSETPGGPGTVLTAFAAGSGQLLPNLQRTTVLEGFNNNSAFTFDPAANGGAGLLTLPGPGVRTVSAGGGGTEPLVPVSNSDAQVPAALALPAQGSPGAVSRTVNGFTCEGASLVFPSGGDGSTISDPTTGEQSNQAITLDDTQGSPVGNPASQTTPDGFLLEGACTTGPDSEIIVFVGTQNGASAFGVSAAGFRVNASGIVESTEGAATDGTFHTPTPTRTPTRTATPTFTPTPTETATSTATATLTPLPPPDCPASPVVGCLDSGKSHFFLRDLALQRGDPDRRDRLVWRWLLGPEISFSAVGNPLLGSGGYTLCIYDEVGDVPQLRASFQVPAGGTCANGKPCWRRIGRPINPRGYRYRDRDAANNGVVKLLVKSGDPGKSKLVLRGRGAGLALPGAASGTYFVQDSGVLLQLLQNTGGQVCWQTRFPAPALKNTFTVFREFTWP